MGSRYGLRPSRHPTRAHRRTKEPNEPDTDLHLSTADHHNGGFHPWLNTGSARWLRFASAPTTTDLQGSSSAWAPGFYIGDLLVYISDQQGPYLLDWDIKQHVGDHGQPGPGNLAKRHSKAAQLRAAARAAVIHAYDAELGIRQVPLAGEEIDGDVAANLFQLLGWHHHEVHHSRSERAELEDTMSASMRNGVSPISLLPTWTRRGWIRQDFLAVVYQAIWSRRIRVDLFRPVLIDRPLKAEIRDVFEVYDQWFRR